MPGRRVVELADLLNVVSRSPNRDHDWEAIERKLQTGLPRDYKAFADDFGLGRIGGFLWVFMPDQANSHLDLYEQTLRHGETLAQLRNDELYPVPFDSFPAGGGLIPWGITDNGDTCYWKTDGEPDEWQVVVTDDRMNDWERFAMGFSEFLRQLLSGGVNSGVMGDEWLIVRPVKFEASP
jgi:hypothetical protein